ncbi:unnamed protein product [Nezara viridula]|uniref:Dedicator of cytokinesis protein 1 n=1 Tax=Nezara viridula TaxID=85310 RepID=A0A9P0H8I6_NEZVI|nr:unnamed protein product [Nezara viridula]
MMNGSWTDVNISNRFGIVVHNFQQEEAHRLRLSVGESVLISQENGEWYFGNSTKNRYRQGIFPKSYVKIMESIVDKSGPTEEVVLKQPKIVQEISSVLREWGELLKELFVYHSENFRVIKALMYDLMTYRSQIISGKFPADELKQIKRIVTSKIDVGNNLLGLDMVVRDDQGNILNPEVTSTVELYRHHHLSKERILKATSEPISKEDRRLLSQQYCHALFVCVREFVCKLIEDFELLMCLYDVKEGRPFTENHVIRWSKGAPLETDIPRVLFTDLGTRDILREKVYLVSYVVRLGGMEKTLTPSKSQPSHGDPMRRPFGVAAKDITLYVNGKLEPGEEDTVILPLLMCEKDNLEGTLRRILTIKDLTHKDHKGYGLSVRLKMLHGDLKQVREENPHLILGQVSVARKMGFPEVILPGDVRNDLYLTLVSGEFSKGSKSTDKNVQVTVQVCNENGQVLQGVIHSGGENNEYRSVIYYHEDKPRWAETCKIAVPIEEFKVSHLRFMFKHRSSNETKDRNEKPFAMSFVSLMQQNGTTLPDTQHELLVYKVDHKKYDFQDMCYLTMPSRKIELEEGGKRSCNGLTLSNKDLFIIQTNVCSTKLTQNIDLLGLLNWTSEPEQVLNSLDALIKKVSGEEIVKFLQDVLDALFNILMENTDSDLYDKMVFNCLLHIIGLVSDRKYEHFEPVLDLYIKEGFCATLAHHKLLAVLKDLFENLSLSDSEREILLKTMKSLQYIMRFIVRSRVLFAELNGGKDEEEFTEALTDVLQSLGFLMRSNSDTILLIQGACLKYLPSTIPDILLVFRPVLLSQLLSELIDNVPPSRLTKQKMMTLSDIVHSPLFLTAESRKVLLRIILLQIKDLLETKDEEFRIKTKSVAKVAKVLGESEAKLQDIQDTPHEPPVELCVNILCDIMELLFRDDIGPTVHDLQVIMHSILRTVIQTTITMDREEPLVGSLVSIMLAILRQMGANHFEDYIKRFPTRTDLLDFLMEILLVFKDLVSRPVFPRDWCEMIMIQNSIILKALRFFSHTIRDYFSTKFEHQAWNNFFHCAISFLTQPALQLETFSEGKRRRVIARYKDMRMETGFEIRSMWFNLGQNKKQFIPGLVGPFLEMTLIPESDLRKATLPIFFDMMQCEFYSPRDTSDNRRDSTQIKANFLEFENEMISKLDNLVEGGRGDEDYKDLFFTIVSSLCENHAVLKDQGLKFVKTVTRLMERLLEYRCIINDENKENRMSCTVNLLDFYSEINRKQMYIRYLNKLCDLHLESDNYTEAAYTLKLHSKLLSWSDVSLSTMLRSSKYPNCQTHRQLKEALYHAIIDYFDQGKMWENAVEVCKELAKQYEEQVHDLPQLSSLLRRMADFYDNIMYKLRPAPEYFRVAYYGRGFPPFLQNKVFIYRGKEYERLSDFCTRTLNQFPKAELMNTLTLPSEDVTESPNQYIQINKVEPIMDEKKQRSFMQTVSSQVLKFHRVNNVQKFRFSRPYHKRDSMLVEDNEFATLWIERNILVTSYPLPGILRWFPVTSTDTYQLSPLANAIETMQTTNDLLKELIMEHKKDPSLPINPLSLRLNGIVDAAVMGGINNYEKAFFTPEYMEANPDKVAQIVQLKELIASQIPLLEVGIKIHGDVAPPALIPFQQRLEQCFAQMQSHVVSNYGAKSCEIKYEPVTLRRQTNKGTDTNRLSGTSFGSTEGNRSRVSSLTKSQVASLKTFVNFASLSPSSTLTRAGSAYVRSTSASLSTPSISRKEKKKKRRHTNKERECPESPRPNSQWYTSPVTTPTSSIILDESPPIFELRQQLTPTRPLRSEVEKERRLSRPPSGQFQNRLSLPSTNGNRDSLGTTDSTASEEDPPPLPAKTREADYCNLPDETDTSLTISQAPSTPRVRNKPVPPVPVETNHITQPPTPPPKRPVKALSSP